MMLQKLIVWMGLTLLTMPLIAQRSAQNLAQGEARTLGEPLWVTEVGITTFRTNMAFVDGKVYIGSNGATREAGVDRQDGVYAIDGKTGKVVARYGNQIKSADKPDADVCGVFADDAVLAFGNDDGQFLCYHREKQQLKWQQRLRGHFEGVPAATHLNADGVLDFVAAVKSEKDDYFLRNGILYAFDGETGDILWKFTAPDQGVFMGSPALTDLNDDGTKDALIGNGLSGGYLYAVNGKDGSLLWKYKVSSGIHSSPMVIETYDGGKRIVLTESYSGVHILNADGEARGELGLNLPDGGITGLFASPLLAHNGRLIVGSSWWGNDDLIYTVDLHSDKLERQDLSANATKLVGNNSAADRIATHARVSATPIYFEASSGKRFFMLPAEDGKVYSIDAANGNYVMLAHPGSIEASLFMEDVNRDGRAEILVATREGKLYCYASNVPVGGKRNQIFWGSFRGNRLNTGEAVFKLNK